MRVWSLEERDLHHQGNFWFRVSLSFVISCHSHLQSNIPLFIPQDITQQHDSCTQHVDLSERKITRKDALERHWDPFPWAQPQFPSAVPNPSPILLSLSVNGPGSWEPWPMHHFSSYFSSGHRPENNIFFLPFSSFQSMSRSVESFFLCCPWVRLWSFTSTLSQVMAGLFGVLTAEMLGLQHCQLHRQAPKQPKSVEHHLPVTAMDASSLGCHHSSPCSLHPLHELGTFLPHLQFFFKQAAMLPTVTWWGHTMREAKDRKILLSFQSWSCSPASLTLPLSSLILDRKGFGKDGHVGHPGRHKALKADSPVSGCRYSEQCWVLETWCSTKVYRSCCTLPWNRMPCKKVAG